MGSSEELKDATYHVLLICTRFVLATADSHPSCVVEHMKKNTKIFSFYIHYYHFKVKQFNKQRRFSSFFGEIFVRDGEFTVASVTQEYSSFLFSLVHRKLYPCVLNATDRWSQYRNTILIWFNNSLFYTQ